MADLYAFDTNVYIRSLRDPQLLARFKRFLMRAGTRVRVSAVVALELRAGARTRPQQDAVAALLRPYAERQRVTIPSFEAYVQAGRVLAALATRERYVVGSSIPALTNDALLAASCREEGVVLVTDNDRDFSAIKRHLRGFRFRHSGAVLR
jgi:predicted nucleic acid-binding protein